MILGAGIDIIEVERIGRAAQKEGFLGRIFTPGEQAFLAARKGSVQSMAGMFAAKEAVSKALGTGFSQGIRFLDIEICHRENGMPYAQLWGCAAAQLARMGGGRVHISISHVAAMAVAQAVIEDG